jgi:DNA-binding response OmpR family regulator
MMSSATHSIIVVDDEIELATLFKTFLNQQGFNTISFVDPVLALEYFKETSDKYSLIITDLRMPGLNGLELAKKVRELNTNIRIFLMTAFETRDLENHVDFKMARIDRLIQKPVRFSDLKEMIKKACKT